MKHRLVSLIILPLILAGCASITPTDTDSSDIPRAGTAREGTDGGTTSPSTTITAEDFKKIPKDLLPEDLEKREDTTVVIRAGDNRTIREYRIGGFLYAIQVIPDIGPPYMLVAADNPGYFIRRDKPEMLIPSWTIFEWD